MPSKNLKISEILRALAEPRRIKIIEILAKRGSLSASSINKKFKVTPSAISQHLKILLEAKVLYVEKKAQKRFYRINLAAFSEIEAWTKQVRNTWDNRFDRLENLLKGQKKLLFNFKKYVGF